MLDYVCFYCGRFIDGLMGKVYKHGDDAVCQDCENKYHGCAKNTEQQVQPDNGGMCTRPDVFDCHAKVGTGGRCMNIVPCPPLQVN